ncbi:hypothetical protein OJJOAM_004489 [Cupriavidus sp. H18C1]
MSSRNWEAIHGFESPGEYGRFRVWLEAQVDAGLVEPVSVSQPSSDLIFGVEEHWYRCKITGELWRLIAPEPPLRGFWGELV